MITGAAFAERCFFGGTGGGGGESAADGGTGGGGGELETGGGTLTAGEIGEISSTICSNTSGEQTLMVSNSAQKAKSKNNTTIHVTSKKIVWRVL